MISNIQNIKKARELRMEGKSLSEISKETSISKSTLSYWLKDMRLNDQQLSDLKNRTKIKMSKGRMNALIYHRTTRIFKEKTIYEAAEKEFKFLRKEPLFVLGMALYWSRGSKKSGHFQFSSTDREMITLMNRWIKFCLKIEDDLVKQRNYGNLFRIEITRIDVLRKMMAWQKLLIKYYASISSV